MSDKKPLPQRRKLDPAAIDAAPAIGELLRGLGAGVGHGIANRMGERQALVAAALQGLLASGKMYEHPASAVGSSAVALADATLAQLDLVTDPRKIAKDAPGLDSIARLEP